MKVKTLAILIAAVAIPFGASAAQGSGTINFKGSVIDAPCSISADTADQTIDFGQISKTVLAQTGGTSPHVPIRIKLLGCDLANFTPALTNNTVAITFSGQLGATAAELLTNGPTNTAIIINGYGQNVTFGTAFPGVGITAGDNTLNFDSWVKQAAGKTVAEGDFSAVASFSLSYS